MSVRQETPDTRQVTRDGDRTVAVSVHALDARSLRAAFLDLVGRPPYRREIAEWSRRGLDELLEHVLQTGEFWSNWLEEQLYFFLLVDAFRPRSERVLATPADMAQGRVGVREALLRIALCPSFDRRNPGPDTFVTVVMEQLLGTTVQKRARELDIGKSVYDGAPGRFLGRMGDSQADVVKIAIEGRQALRYFLEREHARILRSEPESKDLSRWTRELEADDRGYAKILGEGFLSQAYARRLETFAPLPSRAYVRALFVDLTDALPGEDEQQRLCNALDGLADAGPLRAVIARLVIDSDEVPKLERAAIEDPTRWVGELFERLLGRAASTDELKAFVSAFHDESCTPATVVYAIVSHPEYPTW